MDPDPGGPKNVDPVDPDRDTDPEHCLSVNQIFAVFSNRYILKAGKASCSL
jgi:hypothetical protein